MTSRTCVSQLLAKAKASASTSTDWEKEHKLPGSKKPTRNQTRHVRKGGDGCADFGQIFTRPTACVIEEQKEEREKGRHTQTRHHLRHQKILFGVTLCCGAEHSRTHTALSIYSMTYACAFAFLQSLRSPLLPHKKDLNKRQHIALYVYLNMPSLSVG